MRPWLRRILIASGVAWGLSLVVALVAYFAIPQQAVIDGFVEEAETASGLQATVVGGSRAFGWPLPKVRADGLLLSDPAQPDEPPILRTGALVLRPSLRALIAGVLSPKSLVLSDVRLSTAGQGFKLPDSLSSREFTVRWQGNDRTVSLSGPVVMGTREVEVEAQLGSLDDLLQGRPSGATAAFTHPDGSFDFDGTVQLDAGQPYPFLDGKFTADLMTPSEMLSVWFPDLPSRVTDRLDSAEMTGRIQTTEQSLLLRGRAVIGVAERVATLEWNIQGGPEWTSGSGWNAELSARSGGLFSLRTELSENSDGVMNGPIHLAFLDLPGTLQWMDQDDLAQLAPTGHGLLRGVLTANSDSFRIGEADFTTGSDSYQGDAMLDLAGQRPLLDVQTGLKMLSLPSPPVNWPGALGQLHEDLGTRSNGWVDLQIALDVEALDLAPGLVGPAQLWLRQSREGTELSADVSIPTGGQVLLTAGINSDSFVLTGTTSGLEVAAFTNEHIGGALAGRLELRSKADATSLLDAEGAAEFTIFGGTVALPDLAALAAGSTASSPETPFVALEGSVQLEDGVWSTETFQLRGNSWAFGGELRVQTRDGNTDGSLTPLRLPAEEGSVLHLEGMFPALVASVAPGARATLEPVVQNNAAGDPSAQSALTEPAPADIGVTEPNAVQNTVQIGSVPIPRAAPR